MTTAHDAEVESTDPKLAAKLTAHPSVQAVLARRRAGDVAGPRPVIEAAWLRQLCLSAGADDAATVSLDHPNLAGEHEHVLPRCPAPAR